MASMGTSFQDVVEFFQEYVATKSDVMTMVNGTIQEAESRIQNKVGYFTKLQNYHS